MTNIAPQLNSIETSENQVLEEVKVSAMCGITKVEWDNEKPVTPVGQLVFFSQYLKCSELFRNWVTSAPLSYTSNNAPAPKDILGTVLLSVLLGHKRYCNVEQIFGDEVSAKVLGINKICSDDSTRRGIKRLDETDALEWLNNCLKHSWEPMLERAWILDIDSTVKPVFGKQEGSAVGYNPSRPGRPSFSFHSYFIANTRITLGVEVHPGNEHAGSHALPGLFQFIDQLSIDQRPNFIRGDVSYGSESMILQCEARQQPYLFKIKKSPKVKSLIKSLESSNPEWKNAGQGWQGHVTELQLSGWSCKRKVLILRRQHKEKLPTEVKKLTKNTTQDQVLFPEMFNKNLPKWEYAPLVTDLEDSVMAIAQHYRDRGDCENNYDEFKNQWGWGGFTSKDLSSTKIMASIVALVSNWWNIYSRLIIPQKHAEAITSRPLLLDAVGVMIRGKRERRIRLSTNNKAAKKIALATQNLVHFLNRVTAEQFEPLERWKAIIRQAFITFEIAESLSPPRLLE